MHDNASSRRIERRLTGLFPSVMLEDHAEEVGVVERNRKLQMPPLVWSLVFGFATGESRSLADFRPATTPLLTTHSVRVASTNS